MDEMVWFAAAGGGAFVVASGAVPVARRVALKYDITDQPADRKVHTVPTPYLGGVVFALCAALAPFLGGWTAEAAIIVAGGALVMVVGLIDDVRTLTLAPRLLVETAAALLAAAAGARISLFDNPLDWALTVLWLVVITNAFNLLDNMDGVAGLIATTTAGALLIAAALEGQYLVGALAAVMAGACLGFLRHNWHPARIFMGDAGSLFLGYMLAVIALKLRFPVPESSSVPAVLMLMGPAVFDTTLVVIARVGAGRPLLRGGTDHTSHRLLRLGLSPQAVAFVLTGGCALSTGLGVLVGRGALSPEHTFVPLVIVGVGMLVLLLRVPVYSNEVEQPAPRLRWVPGHPE